MSKFFKKLLHHLFIISLIVSVISMISCNQKGHPTMENILIVTGGHNFEPTFYKIFDSYTDVKYDTISQPRFNQMISSGMTDKYTAVVFYDMWQEITEEQKQSYIGLLNKGQGMVFLHHALYAYQLWDEFINILGGKAIEKDFYDDPNMKGSTYTEDITLDIKVVAKNHPVTKGISDFSIYDEGYQYIEMIPTITPLLTTTHPDCTPTVAWANKYKKSRIIYILLGHGRQAHEDNNYRKIVRNAISWVGEKE